MSYQGRGRDPDNRRLPVLPGLVLVEVARVEDNKALHLEGLMRRVGKDGTDAERVGPWNFSRRRTGSITATPTRESRAFCTENIRQTQGLGPSTRILRKADSDPQRGLRRVAICQIHPPILPPLTPPRGDVADGSTSGCVFVGFKMALCGIMAIGDAWSGVEGVLQLGDRTLWLKWIPRRILRMPTADREGQQCSDSTASRRGDCAATNKLYLREARRRDYAGAHTPYGARFGWGDRRSSPTPLKQLEAHVDGVGRRIFANLQTYPQVFLRISFGMPHPVGGFRARTPAPACNKMSGRGPRDRHIGDSLRMPGVLDLGNRLAWRPILKHGTAAWFLLGNMRLNKLS